MTPLFSALFDQLEIRHRDQFAFSALLRHRQVLGPEAFQRLTERMDARQRNTFKLLGHSYEDKDFHLAKKRSKDGVSFGIIANVTINKLLDRQNRTMRAEGAVTLTQELEKAEPEKFALLLPYVGSFIKFLGSLLSSDASPKVL